jgi:hypothetical protein
MERVYDWAKVQSDPHAVQIYVDGSHFPNDGRRSGFAGVVLYPNDATEHEVLFEGFEKSTNNRMELSAVIAAMEWVQATESIRHETNRRSSLIFCSARVDRASHSGMEVGPGHRASAG